MLFTSLLEFSDLGLFVLRLAVGIIFIFHSIPKLKNPKGMAQGMGKPNMSGVILLLGVVELFSGLFIIFGFLTQLAAIALGIILVSAIFMKVSKWHVPFVAMDKTGWEFDLILLSANAAILFTGGGAIGI